MQNMPATTQQSPFVVIAPEMVEEPNLKSCSKTDCNPYLLVYNRWTMSSQP